MRKLAEFSNKVTAGIATRGFERRAVRPASPGRTALVLVKHDETAKAFKVSDTGDTARAVWVPKVMLTIEQPSERSILVATMSREFARQKGLAERHIDPAQFNEATREALADAVCRAARKRNFYRGHRPGRARQDTQHQFC